MHEEPAGNVGGTSGERRSFFYRMHGEWLEILSAVLLALATVASAWSAYQAARWSHEESLLFNEATAARVHADELDDLADTELDIDVEMFLSYLDALRAGDSTLVDEFETQIFRDEMKVAVGAWKAAGQEAPGTPFEMPQYVNANRKEASALEQEAQRDVAEAKEAISTADSYVLLTVLFASVLFFAGICTKFKTPWIKVGILGFGAMIFGVSLVVMILQPAM